MKVDFNQPPGTWSIALKGLGFLGKPQACFCDFILGNSATEKLKLRLLTLSSQCGRLNLVPVYFNARVPPGAQVSCKGQLALPPHTPPGDYVADLCVGDKRFNVPVRVSADDSLVIRPRRVNLRGAAGEHCHAEVEITNSGNVPLVLGEKYQLWLEARNWAGATVVSSLRSFSGEGGYEGFLNHTLEKFQKSMLKPITVTLACDHSGDLLPGDTKRLTLEVELPRGMEKGKTYHGFVKLNRHRFWFAIYCTGLAQASKRRE